jgi:Kef-type K+ transport system membrane component KefB
VLEFCSFATGTVFNIRGLHGQSVRRVRRSGVSDIGIIFPLWFSVGLALLVALPVTTAIMAGLGVAAYRIRRSDRLGA